jgi:hypothetical protein
MTRTLPTVGRIVHITQRGSPEHLAAVVCHVNRDGSLNVAPFGPDGVLMPPVRGSLEDQTATKPLHWHWPEHEEVTDDDDEEDLSGEE